MMNAAAILNEKRFLRKYGLDTICPEPGPWHAHARRAHVHPDTRAYNFMTCARIARVRPTRTQESDSDLPARHADLHAVPAGRHEPPGAALSLGEERSSKSLEMSPSTWSNSLRSQKPASGTDQGCLPSRQSCATFRSPSDQPNYNRLLAQERSTCRSSPCVAHIEGRISIFV